MRVQEKNINVNEQTRTFVYCLTIMTLATIKPIDIRLFVRDASGSEVGTKHIHMQHFNHDQFPFYHTVRVGATPAEEYALSLQAGDLVLDSLVVNTDPRDPIKATSQTMCVRINSAGGGIQATLRFKRTKAHVTRGEKMRFCAFEVTVLGSVYSDHPVIKKIVEVNNARQAAFDKRCLAQDFKTDHENSSWIVEHHREKIQKHQQKMEDAMKTRDENEKLVLEAESQTDALEKVFQDGLEELKGMGVSVEV